MYGEYLFVFGQYLVAYTQTIDTRQEVRPDLMVTASGRQRLNKRISVEDYVSHSHSECLIRRAQMLAAQLVEFLLIKGSLVPHLVDSLLCPLGKEER